MGELGHNNSHSRFNKLSQVKSAGLGEEKKIYRQSRVPQRNMKEKRYFSGQKETLPGLMAGEKINWDPYHI